MNHSDGEIFCNKKESRSGTASIKKQISSISRLSSENFEDEVDDEWSTPLTKISKLSYDHESWQSAKEILEAPSSLCRKVGDEARSIAARYIIDRLKEKNLLKKIDKVAPRLRSAVELLTKPDADYVYPPFLFMLNKIIEKYPEVYTSIVKNIGLKIPIDMKPSSILVSLAKQMVENSNGEINLNWGKFLSLLAITGALAVDSVEAGYSEGVAEIVETFGLLTEQVMGPWILSEKPGEGGGWEGFIKLNVVEAVLPPIPRAGLILSLFGLALFLIWILLVSFYYKLFPIVPSFCSSIQYCPVERNSCSISRDFLYSWCFR